jgi:hypothetical protein
VAVVVYAALLALGWATLPDRVPVHFGFSGSADRYADRATAVLVLAAVGLGLAVLFAVLARWMPRLPIDGLNVPHKDRWTATPDREHRLRGMLADDMYLYGAMTLTLLGALLGLILAVADDPEPTLGPVGWILVSLFVLATLGHAWYGYARRYRRPDAA